jgi:Protein of unknown function (DUF2510)
MSAGWYPNPSGAPGMRYWDGAVWRDAVPRRTNWLPLIIIGAVILGVMLAVAMLFGGGRQLPFERVGNSGYANWSVAPGDAGTYKVDGPCTWSIVRGGSPWARHTVADGSYNKVPVEAGDTVTKDSRCGDWHR